MDEEIKIYHDSWYCGDEHDAYIKLISSALEAIPKKVASRIRKQVIFNLFDWRQPACYSSIGHSAKITIRKELLPRPDVRANPVRILLHEMAHHVFGNPRLKSWVNKGQLEEQVDKLALFWFKRWAELNPGIRISERLWRNHGTKSHLAAREMQAWMDEEESEVI